MCVEIVLPGNEKCIETSVCGVPVGNVLKRTIARFETCAEILLPLRFPMGNVLKRTIARFETCAEIVLPGNGKCTEADHCAV